MVQWGKGIDQCPSVKHFGLASNRASNPGLQVTCSSSPGSYENFDGATAPFSGSPRYGHRGLPNKTSCFNYQNNNNQNAWFCVFRCSVPINICFKSQKVQ